MIWEGQYPVRDAPGRVWDQEVRVQRCDQRIEVQQRLMMGSEELRGWDDLAVYWLEQPKPVSGE